MHRGYTVSAPEHVFVQLAARLSLLDLVVAAAAMVRTGPTSLGCLRETVDVVHGRRRVRARLAAYRARAGVDSPMETRLRLLIVLAGLPEPLLNRDVISSRGGWLARPDLSHPDWKIAIEYDGDHHRLDRRQWHRDIMRRENLEADGWIVLVITAVDVFQRPAPTLMRVLGALDRRGCPDLPRRLDDDWRQL